MTDELAARLYEVWRKRQDVVAPLTDRYFTDGRNRPRPRWQHLDSSQKSVWLSVAHEAGRELAEAAGAR